MNSKRPQRTPTKPKVSKDSKTTKNAFQAFIVNYFKLALDPFNQASCSFNGHVANTSGKGSLRDSCHVM